MNSHTKPVSFSTINALGCGNIAVFFMKNGIWILAIPFFQMTMGVDPFLLSLTVTIPTFIALFLGPVVGEISDRVRFKYGTRKPLMVGSIVISGLTYGLLWLAPAQWSESLLLTYLFTVVFIFQLASSFYIIPLTSLTFEVSKDEYQRTRAIAHTAYYNKICSILYHWAFPLAQLSIFSSLVLGIQVVGWFIAIFVIMLFGFVPIRLIHETPLTAQHSVVENQPKQPKMGLVNSLTCVLANKQFTLFMLVVICQSGIGSYAASFDYYLIVYFIFSGDIGEGSFWKGILSSAYSISAFITIPLITQLIKKVGNVAALQFVFILTGFGGFAKWFLFVPGHEWLLALDAVLCASVWVSMAIISTSLVANLSYDSELIEKQDHKGVFISILHLVMKSAGALALVLSGLTLNWIGFDSNEGAMQSASSIQSMRFLLAGGTVIASILAFFILQMMSRNLQRNKNLATIGDSV